MSRPRRYQLTNLRGAARLAVEATEGVTSAVEGMHGAIQHLSLPWGRAAPSPAGLTGFVYRTIKRTTRLVGMGLDAGFGSLARILPPGESSDRRDVYRSILNGICGDHLARSGNPLAIDMSLRLDGREISPLDPERGFIEARGSGPGRKLLVLVHGLCLDDRHWRRAGHDHGAALAADFGFSPLYLRYNTGLPVAENGRDLAGLLQVLFRRWPVAMEQIVVLGHSMGGLVARSACHQAEAAGHDWLAKVRKMIFLGTPHLGAPLEQGGHQVERALGLSPYSMPLSRLAEARSAGISDLRRGTVTKDGSPAPLPRGVDCCAAAALLAESGEQSTARWLGDGLVPLHSALGRHRQADRALGFSRSGRWIAYGMGHMDLLSDAQVYRQLSRWIEPDPGTGEGPV